MPAKPKRNYSAQNQPAKDLCQTPPYAVDLLIPYLKPDWRIWEPCAGEGLLARRLMQNGWLGWATDLQTGVDFLTDDLEFDYDAIVTNVPFSLKFKMLKRCYDLGKPFALLMPSDTLFAGAYAQPLFEQHGIEILIPKRRINFKMPEKAWAGSAQMSTAWFTHGLEIGRMITFADLKPWKQADVEAWEHAS